MNLVEKSFNTVCTQRFQVKAWVVVSHVCSVSQSDGNNIALLNSTKQLASASGAQYTQVNMKGREKKLYHLISFSNTMNTMYNHLITHRSTRLPESLREWSSDSSDRNHERHNDNTKLSRTMQYSLKKIKKGK